MRKAKSCRPDPHFSCESPACETNERCGYATKAWLGETRKLNHHVPRLARKTKCTVVIIDILIMCSVVITSLKDVCMCMSTVLVS